MEQRIRKPRALLIDLDGTLYRGESRVPDADRLLQEMEQRGIPCWFVTNNSSRTPEEVARHLMHLDIPASADRVITSAIAAADYIRGNYSERLAYLIGERGLEEALERSGIPMLGNTEQATRPALVVQGIDRELTYDKLAKAVQYVLGGAKFVQTNPDLLLPTNGSLLPGAGSIGATITAATGIEPFIIGKPSRVIMDYALNLAGVKAEDAWVIGDNPLTDLAAAASAGCPSVLVLTGLCTTEDWTMRCEAAGVFPDAVCENLNELIALLMEALAS